MGCTLHICNVQHDLPTRLHIYLEIAATLADGVTPDNLNILIFDTTNILYLTPKIQLDKPQPGVYHTELRGRIKRLTPSGATIPGALL